METRQGWRSIAEKGKDRVQNGDGDGRKVVRTTLLKLRTKNLN